MMKHFLIEPNCGLVKVLLLFDAGKIYEQKRAIAELTARMLKKGTSTQSELEISSRLAFFGTDFSSYATTEYLTVQFNCQPVHLHEILDLVLHCIYDAHFVQADLDLIKSRQIEKIKQDEKTSDFYADKLLFNHLFEKGSPYGYTTEIADIESTTLDECQRFYLQQIRSKAPRTFFLAGDITSEQIQYVESKIRSLKKEIINRPTVAFQLFKNPSKLIEESIFPENPQSSVRLGKVLPIENLAQFLTVELLNMALGGGITSELNKILRQKKGYTYGAHSSFEKYRGLSAWIISFETSKNYVTPCLKEIKKIFERLKNKSYLDTIIDQAKKNMESSIDRASDGTLNSIMIYVMYFKLGLEMNEIDDLKKQIWSISSEEILAIAEKELHYEDFIKVVV